MEVIKDSKTNKWKPKEPFKRYHQIELWEEIFDICLNIPNCDSIPNLIDLQKKLEQFLLKEPSRVKSIKVGLCRQNIMLFEFEKNYT